MTTATKAKSRSKTVEAPLREEVADESLVAKDDEVKAPAKSIQCKIPVIRGIQSGEEYYIAMFPIKLLASFFPHLANFPTQEGLDISQRSQRELDPKKAKAISRYVISGVTSESEDDFYVLSSASVSLEAEDIEFKSKVGDFGTLQISGSYKFNSVDGQHRIRGLILAAERCPAIAEETLSIVIYRYSGVRREQQSFADMNGNARVPTKSLTMAFDHRNEAVSISRQVLGGCPTMRRLTSFDRNKCSGKSTMVFGFIEFHKANQILMHFGEEPEVDIAFAASFWQLVVEFVPTFDDIINRSRHPQTARELSIAPTALALEVIAYQGASLRGQAIEDIREVIEQPLRTFDWSITNHRVLEELGGNLRKTARSIQTLRGLIFGGNVDD